MLLPIQIERLIFFQKLDEKRKYEKKNKLKIKFAMNFDDDDPAHYDCFPDKRQK